MSEEIVLQAEVLDDAPATELAATFKPNVIVDNVPALEAWVDQQLEPFQGAKIDPQDNEQVKQARQLCALLNKMADPIDTKRKQVKREYSVPLNEFDARVSAVVKKIKEARKNLKDQVDEADAMFKDARLEYYRSEYEGLAGELANVIPLEALLENEWFQRSKSEMTGAAKLAEKAAKALQGYRTLDSMDIPHKQEVLREYCLTLDTQKALAVGNELEERDRELQRFEEAQVQAGLAQPKVEVQIPLAEPKYRFKIHVPVTEFVATTEAARKLKNHLEMFGIEAAMTRSLEPTEA